MTLRLGLAICFCCVIVSSAAGQLPGGFFTNVKPIANVNDPDRFELNPRISRDSLELYFDRGVFGGDANIWVARRTNANEDFAAPTQLDSPINSGSTEHLGSISRDGLSLFFHSNRDGHSQIFMATRSSANEPFTELVKLFDTPFPDRSPFVTSDGLTLYFDSERPDGTGSRDLYQATRGSLNVEFGDVVELTPLNWSQEDAYVSVSPDDRILFFSDWITTPPRADGLGNVDIWFAPRSSVDDPFSEVVNIGTPINSEYADGGFVVSSDWPANGATAYFASNREGGPGSPGTSGGTNLWQATWVALLEGDYNRDGSVDAGDYVVWRKGLGKTYTQTDYEVWRANFGSTAGSGSALPSADPLSAGTPEPATFVLLLSASVGFGTSLRSFRRGKRCRHESAYAPVWRPGA
jgi:WD40-like Beta Propeller Repeat